MHETINTLGRRFFRRIARLGRLPSPLRAPMRAAAGLPSWQEGFARDLDTARARLAALLERIDQRHAQAERFRMEGGPSPYDAEAHFALLAGAGRKVGVIIAGIHSADWMDALGPAGPVWTLLPEVGRVTVVAADPAAALAENDAAGLVSVVIPLLEHHTRALPPDTPGLFPEPDALDLLSDKLLFGLFMLDHAPDQAPPLHTKVEAIEFPCVVKCTTLNAGAGSQVAHHARALAAAMEDPHWRDYPKVVQGFVPGAREWVTHAVCRAGEVLWHITYEYEMPPDYGIRRPGTPTATRLRHTPRQAIAFLQRLTARLGYEGPLNLDYKRGPDGLQVFEVNPRLGGSLMMPAHVGDLARALRCLITHASTRSLAALIGRSPYFHAGHYARALPMPLADEAELARHYLVRGGLEGRDPGPAFSSRDYLALNGAHCPPRVNPLLHHTLVGAALDLPVFRPERRRLTLAAHGLSHHAPGTSRDSVRRVSAREALHLIAREGLRPPGDIRHYSWELDRFYDHMFVLDRADQMAVFATAGTQYASTPLPLFIRPQAHVPVMAKPGRYFPFWYHRLTDFEAFLERRSRTSSKPHSHFPTLRTFKPAEIDAGHALERRPLDGAEDRFAALFTDLKRFGHGFDGPRCLAYYRGIARCAPKDWFFTYELVERASGQVRGLLLTLEHAGAVTQLNLASAPGQVRLLMTLVIRELCARGMSATDSGVSGYFGGYKSAFFPDTLETDASGYLPLNLPVPGHAPGDRLVCA